MDVCIEMCSNCEKHKWHFPHNQQNYKKAYNCLKTKLMARFPELTIRCNPQPPRVASFQITYQGKLIFSKLKTQKWPKPQEILQQIVSIMDNRSQFPGTSQLKYSSNNSLTTRTMNTHRQICSPNTLRRKNVDYQRQNCEQLQWNYQTSQQEKELLQKMVEKYSCRSIKYRLNKPLYYLSSQTELELKQRS